ncbi:hypothetical protein BJX64DRAFT_289123 [Aspergillus heterothallicus]
MGGSGVVNKAGDTPCQNHDYAYMIDPPPPPAAQAQADDMIILCSRQCPWANGQRLATGFGREFKVSCGMRHGTRYIAPPLTKETLRECVNTCASLLSCRSVDYHERARRCYLSDHQGEPTIPAPGFSSAYDVGCVGACSGGGNCGCTTIEEPEVPYCPVRPGRVFEEGGVKFLVLCDMTHSTVGWKDISGPKGPEECASPCADDAKCQGANWNFERDYCSQHFVYAGQPGQKLVNSGWVDFQAAQGADVICV